MGIKRAATILSLLLFSQQGQADPKPSSLSPDEVAKNEVIESSSTVRNGPCSIKQSTLLVRSKEEIDIDVFGVSFGSASPSQPQTLCLPLNQKVYVAFIDSEKRRRAYHLTGLRSASEVNLSRRRITKVVGLKVKRLVGVHANEPLYTLEEPPYTPPPSQPPTYGPRREARYQHTLTVRALKKELRKFRSLRPDQHELRAQSGEKIDHLLEERARFSSIAFPRNESASQTHRSVKAKPAQDIEAGVSKAIKRRFSAFNLCAERKKNAQPVEGSFKITAEGKARSIALENDTASACFARVLKIIRFPRDPSNTTFPFVFPPRK